MTLAKRFQSFVVRTLQKALPSLQSVDNRGGWWPIIRESFAGAWQRNITVDTSTILSFATLYACITIIAADVAKMRVKLVKIDVEGIWKEVANAAWSPVLRKPNHFQSRIQFFECWLASKLIHGNTYVLKVRDDRQVVVQLFVLDPTRCRPLVTSTGDVYYELKIDDLAGRENLEAAMRRTPQPEPGPPDQFIVPAKEIIHDIMCPLFHPLVGVSPIRACGLAALQGLRMQENSTQFFGNGATPGGVLTAPGHISDEIALRLKKHWDENYTGENAGKVAVLGDGLTYQQMTVNAADAQMIEQLKWTAENVCIAFKMPPHKVSVWPMPSGAVADAIDQQYYSQCLQIHIESIEALLDEGLGMAGHDFVQEFGTEFDLDGLMRMDTPSLVSSASEAIKGGGMSIDEARKRFYGLGKVTGGATPYLQQQNFSLEALAKRDAKEDPFASSTPTPKPIPDPKPQDDDTAKAVAMLASKVVADSYRKALAA